MCNYHVHEAKKYNIYKCLSSILQYMNYSLWELWKYIFIHSFFVMSGIFDYECHLDTNVNPHEVVNSVSIIEMN